MGFLSWEELQSPSYGSGTAIGSAIQAAGGFVCDMYRRYPYWAFPDPTGFGAIVRGISDKLCNDPTPLPPPDIPAVPGGKCKCVQYDVFFTGKLPQSQVFSGSFRVRGAISRASYKANANGLIKFGFNAFNDACTVQSEFNVIDNVTSEDIDNGSAFGRIDSIVRVDGQPDTCGDQPPTYKPKIPPVGDLNRVAPVVIAPGITINTPIIFIRPTVNVNIKPNININIQPTIQLPDLGLNINFQVGGVNINNSFNFGGGGFNPLPDPRTDPPTLPDGSDTDLDLTELYARLTAIKNQLNTIQECACEPQKILVGQSIGNGQSGDVALPNNTKFVVTTITNIPSSYKFQSGLDAPEVLYAGWGWFKYQNDFLAERSQVDAQKKCFFTSGSAKRFAWTLYSGFTLSAIAYYEV